MPRPVAKCGTDAGYYRHLRRTKTEPCEACKRAHADRWLEKKKDPFGRCPCGTPLRTRNTYCSRCRRKHEREAARAEAQQAYEEANKPSPDRWVRRGLIWYPVYEQSEVA